MEKFILMCSNKINHGEQLDFPLHGIKVSLDMCTHKVNQQSDFYLHGQRSLSQGKYTLITISCKMLSMAVDFVIYRFHNEPW